MSAAVYSESFKLPAGTSGAKGIAGVLALLVHFFFFLLLYFSLSWQMQQPQGMVVDIWDSLPADAEGGMPAQQQPQPPPENQAQPVAPKVEAAAVPARADIELKGKKKKPDEDRLASEKLKAKRQAEKKAEQAERRLEVVERQAKASSQAQRRAQAEAAAASGRVIDEYVGKIKGKIRRWIVLPPGINLNIRAEFNVTLLPSGEVLNAILVKSSGNDAYDSAVERAILKAQPLPLPPAEKNLFYKFRDLRLKFSPAESGQ